MESQVSSIAYNDDVESVRHAQQGSQEAFADLYERHKTKIYLICMRAAGNKSEAEALTQRVFLQAFRRLANFCEETDFSILIYRVALETVSAYRSTLPREPLSVEPLIKVARESVYAPSPRVRFAHMRSKVRETCLNFSANHSWASAWRLGRTA